jgi:hypothetical protein
LALSAEAPFCLAFLFLFQQLEKERREKERKHCWCRFAKTQTMAKVDW